MLPPVVTKALKSEEGPHNTRLQNKSHERVFRGQGQQVTTNLHPEEAFAW